MHMAEFPLTIYSKEPNEEEEDEDAEGDNDQSAIHHPSQTSSQTSVAYSIIHSPTYQVPVLYFSFRNLPSTYNPNSLDTVYQLLAPKETRQDLESFGVMGAISMAVSTSNTSQPSTKTDVKLQNHPITDFPCFFIHPCNTAEAMGELLRGRAVGAFEYLLIWLGLVGSCVGLFVPKEFALSAE
ncbi:hypothetical protein G7Y79_00011g030970 [Physcia stellaris]|nr:hypothetical protein G7Y79_00011g030970 [Physcia stellaris]